MCCVRLCPGENALRCPTSSVSAWRRSRGEAWRRWEYTVCQGWPLIFRPWRPPLIPVSSRWMRFRLFTGSTSFYKRTELFIFSFFILQSDDFVDVNYQIDVLANFLCHLHVFADNYLHVLWRGGTLVDTVTAKRHRNGCLYQKSPILSSSFLIASLQSSLSSRLPPADNKDVSVMMSEMDVNAIAGTLKLYFRELPEPLFTDELYPSFAGGISKTPQRASNWFNYQFRQLIETFVT